VQCAAGRIGHNGVCIACSDHAVASCKAGQVTSSVARDECLCRDCSNGRMGSHCEHAANVNSFTCPTDGYKLLPGTVGGEYFRCGGVWNNQPVGWYGNCVPAEALCDGTNNCEDHADEQSCSDDTIVPCAWPLVRDDTDGVCKECTDDSVQNAHCMEGQIGPSTLQDSCICFKCEKGWLGPMCNIEDNQVESTTQQPTQTPTQPPSSEPMCELDRNMMACITQGGFFGCRRCTDDIAGVPCCSCQDGEDPVTTTDTTLTTATRSQTAGQCKPWCATHPKRWEQKCRWTGCAGCSACSA